MNPQISITQDQIQAFPDIEAQFMREVLGLEGALVTDESDLSDFEFTGMPEGAMNVLVPMRQLRATWDAWAIARIEQMYGIKLTTTVVNMVWLLNQVSLSKSPALH